MRRHSVLTGLVLLLANVGCEATFTLSGTVVDPVEIDGPVVSAALVLVADDFPELDSATDIDALEPLFEARTDADGRFQLDGLPADRYDLVVFKPGHFVATATARLADGDRDVEVELSAFAWEVELIGAETRDFVEAYTSGYGYAPDAGYQWLAIELGVMNLSSRVLKISS